MDLARFVEACGRAPLNPWRYIAIAALAKILLKVAAEWFMLSGQSAHGETHDRR